MLDPRKLAFGPETFGPFILIGKHDVYAYADGQKTDVVTAVGCDVVLPEQNYEKLTVKLPIGTEVDPAIIGHAVDFADFAAHIYVMDNRVGFSAKATGVKAAKPEKA